MTKIKLCKDCEHFAKARLGDPTNDRYCERTRVEQVSLIDGSVRHVIRNCASERAGPKSSFKGECGPSAKFFSPRKPWWKRWLG